MTERSYSVTSSKEFDLKCPGNQSFGNADMFRLVKKVTLKSPKTEEEIATEKANARENEVDPFKSVGMVSVKRMHAGTTSTVFQLTTASKDQPPTEQLFQIPGIHEVPEGNAVELCGFMLQSASLQKATWALQTVPLEGEAVTILITFTRERGGVAASYLVLNGVKPVPDTNGGHKLVNRDEP